MPSAVAQQTASDAAANLLVVSRLKTVAETSDFQSTATYQDVMEYCEALAAGSQFANLSSMGKTSEGRQIPLLILADPPIQTAAEANADSRPVFSVMANIHAGEVCGKEASLILARKLLSEKSTLLQQLIIVIAPIYNADGNERFSTTNRPGQVGPVNGMGQRPNAMGLDLNRDHMKLESPEARSLAGFMSDWQPVVAMDLHTTDGSFHRFGLTYDSPRHPATHRELLRYGRDTFMPEISKTLADQHQLKTFFYGNFDRHHKNWLSYPAAPRYSTHYFGLRNCLGILSEAYAYSTFKDRIIATEQFVLATLQKVAAERDTIQSLITDAKAKQQSSRKVAIRATEVALPGTFVIPAWEEEVAGRGRKFTDDDRQTEYTVQYHGDTAVSVDVSVPAAYVVPANQQAVIENLSQHGVQFEVLSAAKSRTVTLYSVTNFEQADREFQGHRVVSDVTVEAKSMKTVIPAGSIIVSTDQPLAALIINLLEPEAADGLTAWNFFDAELKLGQYPIQRIERP
ncbi:MAG: M14 family metallopeptidase [Fuerstiella sp.]